MARFEEASPAVKIGLRIVSGLALGFIAAIGASIFGASDETAIFVGMVGVLAGLVIGPILLEILLLPTEFF